MKKLLLLPLLSIFMIPSGIFGMSHIFEQALSNAAKKGNLKVVRKMLLKGADINTDVGISDHGAYSPIAIAAENGRLGVVIYLLEEGAELKKDVWNQTPEDYARQNNNVVIADLLKNVAQAEQGKSGDAAMQARHGVLAEFKMSKSAQIAQIAEIAEDLKRAALKLNIEKIYGLTDQLIQFKKQ